jgi:hypothetical protein
VRRTRLKSRTAAVAAAALTAGGAFAAIGIADSSSGPHIGNVPNANPRAAGYAPANVLASPLQDLEVARGSTKLENPQGIIGWYGYENDAPSPTDPSLPQMAPASLASPTEAQKTEPDKNTYLDFKKGLNGADSNYDYGEHFVYQGHEGAARDSSGNKLGYLTRINLDADSAHRVTLMATKDTSGAPLSTIDGSTWDPFAKRLILTTESATAPTYAATASYPSTVEDVSGALGRGGYEGVQNDSDGNLWLVEDIGGPNKAGGGTAKQPNSFVYRYVPKDPGDLHNGKLQVLQVRNDAGDPITFESQAAVDAPDQVLIHTYHHSLRTQWVTIHDTATQGNTPFNANTLAKAQHGTPFKRPENGLFRPGSHFREFFFDGTGDTNATSPENGDPETGEGGAGGWSAIHKLVQSDPSASTGRLELFYEGNQHVAGLDNTAFLSRDKVTFVEDAGDTLHGQRNALDSGFVFDLNTDYANRRNQPTRWLAEGRDIPATLDAANGGFGKNDGDNEITGTQVSDGDPSPNGILGAKIPNLFSGGWRWFWTQQHGDNQTFEVLPLGSAATAQDGQGNGHDAKRRARGR